MAYTFQGWLGHGPDAVDGKMQWGPFEPKTWEDDDVDIKVTHCGICGSDLHTLRSGWGATPYPCCVGHEIVGTVVRLGQNVRHLALGDRVGVGAQARSCLRPDCPDCAAGRENYCPAFVGTYGDVFPGSGGDKSYGGYGDYHRAHARFVIPIPDRLPSHEAAPLLCAGATVWTPLTAHGCAPGRTVGIVGIGGLGHIGVMFAKALGADRVVGISRKAAKRADALALGADAYIATDDDTDWIAAHRRSLDLIVSTVSSKDMPLDGYLQLLATGGTYVQVGNPDNGALPPVSSFTLLSNGIGVAGSSIASPDDIAAMLRFVVEHDIHPRVQTRPLSDANQAIIDMHYGRAKYRYVLVNEKNQES